ncbi:hypothetical protein HK097_002678 [Rhizophlyctis rosea]|uniref:F-box domain-containing protein n=1 Tax=Rhizophlyctis rosea TaxID=64517 RepID=A0AAD5X6H4_9FUNG|nr:hypothetical protein HK097_002678 [Rhizophlyctis rosea]
MQTSNTYLLTQIFSYLPVDTIVNCERTCRLWKDVSLSYPNQIWQPKLLRAFPEGCAPERCGEENWRDLAILWGAWGRQWKPKLAKIDVVELGEHEAFCVCEGFKHQLTFVASHTTTNYDIRGVSLNGEVIYRTDLTAEPLHQWNVLTAPNRSTVVPSKPKQLCTFVRAPQPYPTIFTILAANLPIGINLSTSEAGLKICGEVYASYWWSGDRRYVSFQQGETAILGDGNPKPFQQSASSLLSFNETIAAYFKPNADGRLGDLDLEVIRLKDRKLIARSPRSLAWEPNILEEKLIVTGFNILHFHGIGNQTATTCDVYDFYLNHCAILTLTDDVVHLEVSDDGRFIIVRRREDRMVVFDVLKRQKIRLVNRQTDKRDGWFFGVTEYAVDKEGKRTGAGDSKIHFRPIDALRNRREKTFF